MLQLQFERGSYGSSLQKNKLWNTHVLDGSKVDEIWVLKSIL